MGYGTFHHMGRLGAGPCCLVIECLAVQLLVLVAGKMVAQPYPAVALVQPVKGGPETVDGQMLVSFNTQKYSFFVKQKKK